MKRTAGFRLLVSFLIALLVTALAWSGLAADVFGGTQLRLVDGLFPAAAADPRIAVVAIDDRSLGRVGEQWPWRRGIHAELVDRIAEGGASWIGYDVTFSEPGREPGEDEALTEALTRAGNVVLASIATFEGRLGELPRAASLDVPIPPLGEAAAATAHVNVIPDRDGVVRALPPVIEAPNLSFFPSLSLTLFLLEEGGAGPVTLRPEGVQIGERLIPTSDAHLMDLNFAEGFDGYSAADVLDGDVPSDAFQDRIVLVGATALGLGDLRLTPLDKATGQPGVLLHAHALNTMLAGAYLRSDGLPLVLGAILALALLVVLAVSFLPLWLAPLPSLGLGFGYYLLAFWRFDRGQVMNLVYPALAVVVAFIAALGIRYFTEVRERRRVTRVFGRYVAGDVVAEVLAAPEHALATLEGESRPISVLFADLRGFTSASEGADPKDVVAALNVYLDAMVRAVNEELGTIDKFMGDCVMAFWGAPRPTDSHPRRAVRAAVKMLDYIDEAVERGDTSGLRVTGCGVGVATGEAVVGNIGSTDRLDYTVVGDTVNTSSRLCGVAEAGQVVVTKECAEALGHGFRLSSLPPLMVKGKTRPLEVYQVLRNGQEAPQHEEGATLDATDEKGRFEDAEAARAPVKAAGYAPVEPRPDADEP